MSACDRAVFPLVMNCMQTTSPLRLTQGVDVNCLLLLLVLSQTCLDWSAFLLVTLSLQGAGCSTLRILQFPRAWVVLCIVHLTMAMGRLLGEFVHREARGVTPSLRQDLQVLLSERRASWSV